MFTNETCGTFKEIAERIHRAGGPKVHRNSLWRWARKGLRGVILEYRRLGGRMVTSIEAVERFSKRLAELDRAAETVADVSGKPPVLAAARHGTEARREHDISRDARYLDGVLGPPDSVPGVSDEHDE